MLILKAAEKLGEMIGVTHLNSNMIILKVVQIDVKSRFIVFKFQYANTLREELEYRFDKKQDLNSNMIIL